MGKEKLSTKDVLKIISVGSLVVASLAFPNLPLVAGKIYKEWKKFNRRDLGYILKRLQKQEMISINDKGGNVEILITDKGKKRLLEYDFENIQIKKPKRDGKWRLIIFDIPEEKKNSRDVFRKKLLQLGFIRLQDSVWVSAYPCKDEIDFLCNFLEISECVTLASLDTVERGEELVFKQLPDYEV